MYKICLSANTSWYIYNFRRNTISELINTGYYVLVMAPEDEYTPLLKALGVDFFPISLVGQSLNIITEMKSFLSIYKALGNAKPHILLNFTPKNNIYCSLVASFYKIKTINNISGLGTIFTKNNLLSFFVKKLYKISQSKVDFVFFQNYEDKKIFNDNGIVNASKCRRIPGSGVDLQRFKYIEPIFNSKTKFIFIARLLYQKGIMQYILAASEVKKEFSNVDFTIVGFLDESNENYIKKSELTKWVELGVVNYYGISNNIEELLATHDCVVLPSYYREGVPKTLLEGAAMGKAIITTDNVGCRDIVNDRVNGFLCEPKSVNDLISAMRNYLALSNSEKTKFSLESRIKVEKEFDEKIVLNAYLDKIKEVLKET